jgi:hypothetical protein
MGSLAASPIIIASQFLEREGYRPTQQAVEQCGLHFVSIRELVGRREKKVPHRERIVSSISEGL